MRKALCSLTSLLMLLLCGGLALDASARTITTIDEPISGDLVDGVRGLIERRSELFGTRGVQLRFAGRTPVSGGTVLRYQQHFAGLPVVDGQVSALVLRDKVVLLSGELKAQPAVSPELGGLLDRSAARGALVASWPDARVRQSQLAVRLDRKARPVWVMDVARTRPFGLWRVQLDARSGDLLLALSAIRHAQGKAYRHNPTNSSVELFDLPGLTDETALVGEYASVASCGYVDDGLSCNKYAQPDAQGDYLYDPEEPSLEDAFAEVHAYYHVDAIHRWLKERFGFQRKGEVQQIDVIVNFFGENREGDTQGIWNAFYGDTTGDGRGDIAFGQGDRDFAYDADVVYHEFTHSVIAETSDLQPNVDALGMNLMPLALNEAFADIISSAFAGDPKVGEYAGGTYAIRELTGNSRCPEHLTGQSHDDGLIWGQSLWAVRAKLADPTVFDEVTYKTMVSLGMNATIAEAAAALVRIAGETDAAIAQAVTAELTARGVLDCERIVDFGDGRPRSGSLYGTYMMPGLNAIPGPLQYKFDVPADAVELRVDMPKLGDGRWAEMIAQSTGAYVRKDQPVEFGLAGVAFDDGLESTETSLVMRVGDADHPLEPGHTYYFLPFNVARFPGYYEISATVTETAPPPEPDAAPLEPDAGVSPTPDAGSGAVEDPTTEGDDKGGGGGCAVAPAGSLLGLPLLLLGVLLLFRRRG